MFTVERRDWAMPRGSTLLIAIPLLVFMLNGVADMWLRTPAGYFAQPSLQNAVAEAAGRSKTVAAFLLCASLEIVVLVASASSLRLLSLVARKRILIAYFLTVAAGTAMVLVSGAFKGAAYLDQTFACASFSRLERAPTAPVAPDSARPAYAGLESSGNPTPNEASSARFREPDVGWAPGCTAPQFYLQQAMIQIVGVLLLFAMPAVIFGAISCLAMPEKDSPDDRFRAWTRQTRRLSNFLYLAAVFMISGLLFTNARLNWVIYSVHPDDIGPFRNYISSIAMHGGITNSLIIAAYYLPVATWLAAIRPDETESAESARPVPTASDKGTAPDPFAPLKVALTIFAPAIVGLFSEFLKFGG
ncbi:MAG: hypothetical protein E6G92_00380 [Alphaproteobacteria bacterium]|nr:MAG: hypothetical protein E6G92_00380 [Alphaproteobacteria bacterium]